MITKRSYFVILLILSVSFHLNAQNSSIKLENKGSKCVYCVNDGGSGHVHERPYKITFKSELPYLATGIGLFASGIIIKDRNTEDPFTIQELGQLDRGSINSFDRNATRYNSSTARKVSDIFLYSSGIFPLYFLSNHHTRKDFLPLLVMGLEVYGITSGLTTSAKHLFNRARPLTYNSEFSDEERTSESSKLSFFSGHTSQTAAFSFFVAKVINDYHVNMKPGFKIGIWTFAFAVPAITGFSRVRGGNHFPTDVVTGYAVGAAIGFLVPHLHKKKTESKLSLTPFNYGAMTGLTFAWKL